nr:MAG TPA: hypothetical protein [Caudoviricetes sp.]
MQVLEVSASSTFSVLKHTINRLKNLIRQRRNYCDRI